MTGAPRGPCGARDLLDQDLGDFIDGLVAAIDRAAEYPRGDARSERLRNAGRGPVKPGTPPVDIGILRFFRLGVNPG